MSEKQLGELRERTDNLLKLQRAPSQYQILYRLIETGKTMTVGEIAADMGLTPKATERAIAKLLDKGLVQRSPFRTKSYNCDTKQLMLSLLMTVTALHEDYEKRSR